MLCCILQNGDSGESEAAAPHIITIYYLNKMHLGEIAPSVVTRFPVLSTMIPTFGGVERPQTSYITARVNFSCLTL
jgi:hypothetical protein